jgi:hypothetical protein
MHACTGENAVYATETECMTACAGPSGNDGIPDDVSYTAAANAGDSLACRIYHATVAASSSDMATAHCAHTAVAPAMPDDTFPCSGTP